MRKQQLKSDKVSSHCIITFSIFFSMSEDAIGVIGIDITSNVYALAEAVCQFYLDGVRGEDSGVDAHLWHLEKESSNLNGKCYKFDAYRKDSDDEEEDGDENFWTRGDKESGNQIGRKVKLSSLTLENGD